MSYFLLYDRIKAIDSIEVSDSVCATLNQAEVQTQQLRPMQEARAGGREWRLLRATLSPEQIVVRIMPRSH